MHVNNVGLILMNCLLTEVSLGHKNILIQLNRYVITKSKLDILLSDTDWNYYLYYDNRYNLNLLFSLFDQSLNFIIPDSKIKINQDFQIFKQIIGEEERVEVEKKRGLDRVKKVKESLKESNSIAPSFIDSSFIDPSFIDSNLIKPILNSSLIQYDLLFDYKYLLSKDKIKYYFFTSESSVTKRTEILIELIRQDLINLDTPLTYSLGDPEVPKLLIDILLIEEFLKHTGNSYKFFYKDLIFQKNKEEHFILIIDSNSNNLDRINKECKSYSDIFTLTTDIFFNIYVDCLNQNLIINS